MNEILGDLMQFEGDRSNDSNVQQEEEEIAYIRKESKEEATASKKVQSDGIFYFEEPPTIFYR